MVATVDLCLSVVVITVETENQGIAFQVWFLMEMLNCLSFLMPCWFASRITAKVYEILLKILVLFVFIVVIFSLNQFRMPYSNLHGQMHRFRLKKA